MTRQVELELAAWAERTGRLGRALRRERFSFRPRAVRHRGTTVSIAPLPAAIASDTP